ncbi:hypothetical protein TrST_g695 [Triparma strigata]|uniref:Uncharacterized protein n=1 Tax=Triparma strigata TaxID=1606541 RepID=A0A9W7B555_9STRA|nr:hypothetical protein TrST_g695 [Triparma strigata]
MDAPDPLYARILANALSKGSKNNPSGGPADAEIEKIRDKGDKEPEKETPRLTGQEQEGRAQRQSVSGKASMSVLLGDNGGEGHDIFSGAFRKSVRQVTRSLRQEKEDGEGGDGGDGGEGGGRVAEIASAVMLKQPHPPPSIKSTANSAPNVAVAVAGGAGGPVPGSRPGTTGVKARPSTTGGVGSANGSDNIRRPGTTGRVGRKKSNMPQPKTMNANAIRQIEKQKLHRHRVLSARHVTSSWVSEATVRKWDRLRSKHDHKLKNEKYHGMSLSLKLHNNVVNLDAFVRNDERHKALLSKVQHFTNNKESERTKNYRMHRQKMRLERQKHQDFHMQELAATLPRAATAPKSPRPASTRQQRRQFLRSAPANPVSPPRSSVSVTGSSYKSPRAKRMTLMTDKELSELRAKRKKKKLKIFSDGDDQQLDDNADHTNKIISSSSAVVRGEEFLTTIDFLKDEDFLNEGYVKYRGMTAEDYLKIYKGMLDEIPPIITEEDIYLEQRREWDPAAKPFDAEAEKKKGVMTVQHLTLMLKDLKEGNKESEGREGGEGTKGIVERSTARLGTGEFFEGADDLRPVGFLDSPRLRRLKPHLCSEGGDFYFEDSPGSGPADYMSVSLAGTGGSDFEGATPNFSDGDGDGGEELVGTEIPLFKFEPEEDSAIVSNSEVDNEEEDLEDVQAVQVVPAASHNSASELEPERIEQDEPTPLVQLKVTSMPPAPMSKLPSHLQSLLENIADEEEEKKS